MKWPNNAKWAYSITYDEGLEYLLKYVVPLHNKLQFPGHICMVANQIGKIRNIAGSSYNGMRTLNENQILDLYKNGWGVSSHGYSHNMISQYNAYFELKESKQILSSILGIPINIFCVPGNNLSYPPSVIIAKQLGYDAVMTIYDGVNAIIQPFFLLRCPLIYEEGPPFFSCFDPYKRIRQAYECGGWLIDYCHCPLPKPIDNRKDCTIMQLKRRFEAVIDMGDVWLEEPTKVLNYIKEQP